ncbi:MAG: hypothetical protein QM751_01835 [Paludibacteraceae bacterium]
METNNNTIEHVLNNLIPDKITKKKKSPLASIICIIVGIAFFILNSIIHYSPGGFIYPLNLSLGTIFILIGVIVLIFRKKHYFDAETGQVLEQYETCFDTKEQYDLVKFLESGNLKGLAKLKRTSVQALKLRILATKDGRWCFAEALLFTPPQYKQIYSVIQYDVKQKEELFNSLSI